MGGTEVKWWGTGERQEEKFEDKELHEWKPRTGTEILRFMLCQNCNQNMSPRMNISPEPNVK